MYSSPTWCTRATLCRETPISTPPKDDIEGRRALALDCTIDEAKQTQLEIPFKGNVDPKKLEKDITGT